VRAGAGEGADVSEITADEAKAALERSKSERVKLCGEAIEALLEQHKCVLVPTMVLQAGTHPQVSLKLAARD